MAGKTIVVAIDENEFSFRALEWALETLNPSPANDRIILVHANTLPATLGGHGYMLDGEVVEKLEKDHYIKILEFMNKAHQLCQEKEITSEIIIESGDPRDVICDSSQKVGADYLVLGSHGYGLIKRAVLGSVSDYCAHHAKCPVVVVKPKHIKASHEDHGN